MLYPCMFCVAPSMDLFVLRVCELFVSLCDMVARSKGLMQLQ